MRILKFYVELKVLILPFPQISWLCDVLVRQVEVGFSYMVIMDVSLLAEI